MGFEAFFKKNGGVIPSNIYYFVLQRNKNWCYEVTSPFLLYLYMKKNCMIWYGNTLNFLKPGISKSPILLRNTINHSFILRGNTKNG